MNAPRLLQAMRSGEHRPIHYASLDISDPIVETRGWLFRGHAERPLVVVIAGVHGDEYDGISTCIELVKTLRLKPPEASVLVVPVANLEAYEAQQRHTPIDGLDLNRVFPGNRQGSFSEKLAHLIFDSIISQADLVLSLHGWLQTGAVVDYVEIPDPASPVHAQCLGIAESAGFKLVRDTGWLEGRLGAAAVARQIPILESEVGGGGILDPENVVRYLDYVTKAIAAASRADGARGRPDTPISHTPISHFRASAAVRCPMAGFWRRVVEEGQAVETGAAIGEVVRLDDLSRVAVSAPVGGIVGAVRKRARVSEGDELAWVFSS
jgi:predicted deacylase